jgi:hypothetical protein
MLSLSHRGFRISGVLLHEAAASARGIVEGHMKTFIGVAFGAALSLCATSAFAQAAPLMTVLIKPGKIDETASKGDIDVTMTIPDVSAPAGARSCRWACSRRAWRGRP